MREQADEQRVFDQRIGRLEFAVVHVDDVCDLLEGVERDARRQQDAQRRDRHLVEPEALQDSGERIDEEVEVLERAEEPEVDGQRQR